MGNEASRINDVELENAIPDGNPLWAIQLGRFDEQNIVTVISNSDDNKEKKTLFSKYVKVLKSIRHPSIVRYVGSCTTGNLSRLVVERCTPLPTVVDDLDPAEIAAGLYGVVDGLSFLHEKLGISHNNVCPEAVYVAHNGAWQIAGLEHACRFLDVTPEFLQTSRKYRNEHSLSPEEKGNSLTITVEFGHTRDVYAFGVMAECLLERLQGLGDMIKTFELRIQDECLNPDPKQRPKMKSLLMDQLFRNELLLIRTFLQNITLKSASEKEIFFRSLTKKLLSITEEVVGSHLTQLLLCRVVLLDTKATVFIPNILTPCTDTKRPVSERLDGITPILTESVFKRYICPELIKVFHCHDYHIRMVLLTYFPYYLHLFDIEDLEHSILPQVLLGLRDNNGDLAALSLHCLGDLVSVLGRDVVIGGTSKNYFTRGNPKTVDLDSLQSVNKHPEKVLLKDLAILGNENEKENLLKLEKERKKKEQQERLKEVKLKREQARKEKLNRNKEIKTNITNSTSSQHLEPIEKVTEDSVVSKDINTIKEQADLLQQDINDDGLLITGDGPPSSKIVEPEDLRVEVDVYVSHEGGQSSEDDWSDWDNDLTEEQHNDSSPPTKSVLDNSQSIHIDSGMNVIGRLKKDDDDSKVLKHSSDPQYDAMQNEHNHIPDDNTSIVKPQLKPVTKNALKLHSRAKPKPSPTVAKQSLGAEFDIKNIEIKKVEVKAEEELDFFADMVPDIKKTVDLDSLLVNSSHNHSLAVNDSHSIPSKSIPTSNKLAYQAAEMDTEGGAGGWEEDFKWDEGF